MHADFSIQQLSPREGHLLIGQGSLYYRDVGEGLPIIVLHGGPDFDHNYFLPELDRLAGSFRIIYCDQRGRGCASSTSRR